MRIETIYENRSLYRDNFQVQGYYFGSGEKTACIIGSMRGNEYQQLYVCSQLVQALQKAERENRITPGHEILVIPCANPYSLNVEKRFWPTDNTDINRMFPGYMEGETTQRIAGGIFDVISKYTYGMQFVSNYMPGDFMPNVSIMKTGYEDVALAKKFHMPYIVLRNTRPYDTTTLNYNWQIWETKAFSLYTTTTDRIDQESAKRGVRSVLTFLDRTGVMTCGRYEGYVSQILDDDEIISIRTTEAGLFEPQTAVEQEVSQGALLANILDPIDGEVLERLYAPMDGTIFFMHGNPLTYAHTAVIKIIPAVR